MSTSTTSKSTTPASEGFTLIELLTMIAVVSVLAGLLLPVLHRNATQAQNSVCISQLRQLGFCVRLYAGDNGNAFPSAELLPTMPIDAGHPLPRICDVLWPYLSSGGGATNRSVVFRCPSDNRGRFVTEGSSYEWNTELNARHLDETYSQSVNYTIEINDAQGTMRRNGTTELKFPPATTPLLLDYDEFHPRAMISGKNVVFMDGHVSPLDVSPASIAMIHSVSPE